MKSNTMKLIYAISLLLLLFSCEKEEYKKKVDMKNLYSIEANSQDSIEQKRYEIYEKYNIPVFFNDTVGKVYYGQSLAGDSIFRYETIDLAWSYTARSDHKYQYYYMQNDTNKMEALKFISSFLGITSKPLRPLSILVVDSVKTGANLKQLIYKVENKDTGEISNVSISFFTGVRSILFCGVDNFGNNPEIKEKATYDVVKTMIRQRIKNYKNELAPFYTISDKNFYDKPWNELDETIKNPLGGTEAFSTFLLSEGGYNYFLDNYDYTEEQLISAVKYIRGAIGQFGFVSGGKMLSYNSPLNADEDLELFIEEILRYSKDDFLDIWGNSPLVIKKANILYKIIEEELEFNL